MLKGNTVFINKNIYNKYYKNMSNYIDNLS